DSGGELQPVWGGRGFRPWCRGLRDRHDREHAEVAERCAGYCERIELLGGGGTELPGDGGGFGAETLGAEASFQPPAGPGEPRGLRCDGAEGVPARGGAAARTEEKPGAGREGGFRGGGVPGVRARGVDTGGGEGVRLLHLSPLAAAF